MTLQTLAALGPLAMLTGGILVLNLPTRRAAVLALALLVGLALLPGVMGGPEVPGARTAWLRAFPDAVLLTATVAYTLFFGLLLHRLMEASGALAVLLAGVRSLGRDAAERLMWVLLVFGPLFESISGFGLAVMIVVPMLLALGYSPLQTLSLSLISQLAVPWGALAIGVVLGAAMLELPLSAMGSATAVLALPAYGAFWAMALWLARPVAAPLPATVLKSASGLAVFAFAIWGCNRWVSPELGGIAGPVLLAGWLLMLGAGPRNGSGGEEALPGPGLAALLRAGAPHLALVAVLVVTRFAGPVRELLNTHLLLRLPGSGFALPVLYNPGATLALACAVALLYRDASGGNSPGWRAVLGEVPGRWWRVVSALFVLILLARFMLEGGLFSALAGTLTGGLEGASAGGAPAGEIPARGALFVPLIAALGGFLTGSVAGANALFIDLQALLAAGTGLPLLWVTAVQNLLSAGFSALSPARVVFAATMTGLPHHEGAAMRSLLPLGAALLAIGAAALLPGVVGVLAGAPWLTGM